MCTHRWLFKNKHKEGSYTGVAEENAKTQF